MLYVVFYETAPDAMSRIPEVIGAHREHWRRFLDEGTLKLIGPFNPPDQGAMGVFSTREAAEAFVSGDPFVSHGLVSRWEIKEWMEAIDVL